jgi:Ca2+-binding EF-hand superfamily protein
MKLNNQATRDLRRFVTAVFAATLIALNACQTNQNLQPTTSAGSGVTGFDAADANHDGKLSRNEANDFLVNEIFNSRDANHDGRMTAEEWSAGDPSRLADFKKRDANHDGVVTKEEAIAYGRKHGIANKIMREADKNHDGFLDRAEVQAYYASREGPPR